MDIIKKAIPEVLKAIRVNQPDVNDIGFVVLSSSADKLILSPEDFCYVAKLSSHVDPDDTTKAVQISIKGSSKPIAIVWI